MSMAAQRTDDSDVAEADLLRNTEFVRSGRDKSKVENKDVQIPNRAAFHSVDTSWAEIVQQSNESQVLIPSQKAIDDHEKLFHGVSARRVNFLKFVKEYTGYAQQVLFRLSHLDSEFCASLF